MRNAHFTTIMVTRRYQTLEVSRCGRVAMQCCGHHMQRSVATAAPALAWCWRPYLTARTGRFSILPSPSCLPVVNRSPAGGDGDMRSSRWTIRPNVSRLARKASCRPRTIFSYLYNGTARNFAAFTVIILLSEIIRDSQTLPTESHNFVYAVCLNINTEWSKL